MVQEKNNTGAIRRCLPSEISLEEANNNIQFTQRNQLSVHPIIKDNLNSPVGAKARFLHNLDSIKCLYTNADCLTNIMTELRLYAKNYNPKILGVTEI